MHICITLGQGVAGASVVAEKITESNKAEEKDAGDATEGDVKGAVERKKGNNSSKKPKNLEKTAHSRYFTALQIIPTLQEIRKKTIADPDFKSRPEMNCPC